MNSLSGIRLVPSEHMTVDTTDSFPEPWYRRWYRPRRFVRAVFPMPDLLFFQGTFYGHPVVIKRAMELLESGAQPRYIKEAATEHYPVLRTQTWYQYDWRVLASVVMLATVAAIVLLCG